MATISFSEKSFKKIYVPNEFHTYDPESPSELVPKTGEYPTERVFYQTVVLKEILEDEGTTCENDSCGTNEENPCFPIDIYQTTCNNFGFKHIATGAILTFSQSWYTQGVTLGQLLHSVALAPGESTKIAMIDWTRKDNARVDESIDENESLTNNTRHDRSISEVTEGVATDIQSGSSQATVESSSEGSGGSAGISVPLVGSFGGSKSYSKSKSTSTSFSTSFGRRDISSMMAQNIMDSTQQYANASRNRRASIVKEVTQKENERIATRVITNYNHMHALSIHYYEVVQLYRVIVNLANKDRCLFIPMSLINFDSNDIVETYRFVLAEAALNEDIRKQLLLDPNYSYWKISNDFKVDKSHLGISGNKDFYLSSTSLKIPSDFDLIGISYISADDVKLKDIHITSKKEMETINFDDKKSILFSNPYSTSESIELKIGQLKDDTKGDVTKEATVYLQLQKVDSSTGNPLNVSIGINLTLTKEASLRTLLRIHGNDSYDGPNLVAHLIANRLYYSQVIWKSLDSTTIMLLLSSYYYKGDRITEIIDPTPVTVTGNYLVFRMPTNGKDDAEWECWLKEKGILESPKEDIVPLPSGGVFAEAVLGRYNCAEKLDLTRFWNWQDSPLPEKAPDINPITANSRYQNNDIEPGTLSEHVVNIVNPTQLPDPQGANATLSTLNNGSIFRDMSALTSMIGLAQAGLNAATTTAGQAGSQAGTNMQTVGQQQLELIKAILPLIGAAYGVPIPPNSESISNVGAKINQGAKLDEKINNTKPNKSKNIPLSTKKNKKHILMKQKPLTM
ncbi:hypothetical protein ACTIGL_28660 (plasmid) [Bacillus shihchuchen]|uniref:Uncharacterized protein n=1 Tax=Bacillus shihchuchen TaxID=3036942 RepID=A0ABT7L0U2_9BACI|nr:hypothetical protein [Bacillus shihchuchen]